MKTLIIKPNGEKKMLYMDGKLHELLMGFREAVWKHNTSAVGIIDGSSGMGKSTLSMQMGIILDSNFNQNKVFFEPQAFLEGLAKAKKGDCLVFDEAMILSSRSAMSEINRMVVHALSMIRSKNIFILFNINSIFDIDRNLALFRADFLLHVFGETLIDRGKYVAFFKAKDGHNRIKTLFLRGKKYYSYSEPKGNFVGAFTKEFILDEQEYEVLKQININKMLESGIKSRKTKTSLTRDRLICHLQGIEGWELKKIAEISGLSYEAVRLIVADNGKLRQNTG